MFLSIKEQTLAKILQFDNLDCSETDVFNAAIAWATHELRRKLLVPNVENIKAELKDVVKYVRFPTMTTTEFAEIMEKYPHILEWSVINDIYCYIGDKRPLTAAKEFGTQKRCHRDSQVKTPITSQLADCSGSMLNAQSAPVQSSTNYNTSTVENLRQNTGDPLYDAYLKDMKYNNSMVSGRPMCPQQSTNSSVNRGSTTGGGYTPVLNTAAQNPSNSSIKHGSYRSGEQIPAQNSTNSSVRSGSIPVLNPTNNNSSANISRPLLGAGSVRAPNLTNSSVNR